MMDYGLWAVWFILFISKHMKFHLLQQELKSKIYATVVPVIHNMNLVQWEREREREMWCIWYQNAETGNFI